MSSKWKKKQLTCHEIFASKKPVEHKFLGHYLSLDHMLKV